MKDQQNNDQQMQPALNKGGVITSYLILSGEGNIETEHQYCMECKTLEEANKYFDNFKRGEFADTYLYIYKAIKVREE